MLQAVNKRKLLILFGVVLLAAPLLVSSAWAGETLSGEEVVIGADEVIEDDLYVAANEVIVEGTIGGDLVAVGNSVTVDGTVEGDLIAAGQSVEVGGQVDDDVRIAGQALLLSEGAVVEDDLIAAGYSLENEPESSVGGVLWYAGYQALLAGSVGEDLAATLNSLTLGGEIGEDVNVEVDGEDGGPSPSAFGPAPQVPIPVVQSGLTLTESALVGGNLTYRSSAEAQINPGAQIEGDVVREEQPAAEEEEEPARDPVAETVLESLRSFVSLLLVGLLLVWLAPGWVRRRAGAVIDRPLVSLGLGLLGLVAFLVLGMIILLTTILLAIVFGLLTLGGLVGLIIVLGLLAETVLVLAFWISTGYIAQIVIDFLVGVMLLEAIGSGRGSGRVQPLVVGLIVYVILRTVPVLGAIVGLAVVLLGLGALLGWIWSRFRRGAPPPAA